MTLLIALIANAIFEHMTGEKFIDTGWIVVIWIFHLGMHSNS